MRVCPDTVFTFFFFLHRRAYTYIYMCVIIIEDNNVMGSSIAIAANRTWGEGDDRLITPRDVGFVYVYRYSLL